MKNLVKGSFLLLTHYETMAMITIKLGGSVIQETIDAMNPQIFSFIQKLEELDDSFVITVGGGKISRLLINPVKEAGGDSEDMHKIGIRAVLLQAEYVRALLPRDRTFPYIIESERMMEEAKSVQGQYKYFVSGSWFVGSSSDFAGVTTAALFETDQLLRISNIDYVYDKDPRTHHDAQKLDRITWDEYLNIIGNPSQHEPGGSYPIDPLSARFAREKEITIYFTDLSSFLVCQEINFNHFHGTIIG